MMARTLSISTVWDRTTDFLSGHWRPAALISIATISVNEVLGGIVQPMMQGEGELGIRLAAFVITIIGALWAFVGHLAVTSLALDPTRTPAQAAAIGMARLPAMVGATLMLTPVVLILAAPLVVAILFQQIDLVAQPWILPRWSRYYMVLLAVLILAGWARLILMTPLFAEGAGSLGAIRRSIGSTRGHFWKLFAIVILYVIVSLVIAIAIMIVSGGLLPLLVGDWAYWAGLAVNGLVSGLMTMAALIFIAKLHHALTPAESGS